LPIAKPTYFTVGFVPLKIYNETLSKNDASDDEDSDPDYRIPSSLRTKKLNKDFTAHPILTLEITPKTTVKDLKTQLITQTSKIGVPVLNPNNLLLCHIACGEILDSFPSDSTALEQIDQ